MNYQYRLFGLNVESEIPFFDFPTHEGVPDVCIRYGSAPKYLSEAGKKGKDFQISSNEVIFTIDKVARYYVSNGCRILLEPFHRAKKEDILLFLMGSAMGALLYQRNILPLHGSSVRFDDECIIFIGPTGIGKSTIAAGFCQRGYRPLADDICALSVENHTKSRVIPGIPQLKLWEDTLSKLETKRHNLKSVRIEQDKVKYYLPVKIIEDGPIPVKIIGVLKAVDRPQIEIIQLKGMEKIEALIDNTYRVEYLNKLGMKEKHFQQCASIAKNTPVFKVTRPKKLFLLEELMDLVQKRLFLRNSYPLE
ncbi:MAG: hypothetical protein HOD92_03950 [Deltaproteobacteria bacterium]|jgi:hypothetical protein|nr:hypothetical protein [Deltaproteobacteria bacterium]MBT4640772.1 hypothetical protein [Deltaproteobacteria bacterium]